jgi:glycosyltransferase involved in cell wall biosynthesis
MNTGPFTLVVSHLVPTLGLERCVLRLSRELDGALDLVCVGEDEDALAAAGLTATVLGAPLRGWRRLASVPRLRRWARGRGSQGTVVAAGVWAAVPLLLALGRHRPRVVVWEHSFSREKIRSARGLRLLSAVARIAYRRADLVVCVSDDLRDQIAGWTPATPVMTIPNYLPSVVHDHGSDVPSVPHQAPGSAVGAGVGTRGRRLLTVGSLTTTKNQRLVLEALRLLPATHVLAVAGDGEQREQLESLAEEWGLADRVDFLGHVTDVDAWYRWCDVLVQPSWGETFGLAMFEAAAHHRAVVSVDYGLARALVPRSIVGRLVRPVPSDVASAVADLLADPPDPETFRQADRVRGELFDEQMITETWRSVLAPVGVGARR